MAEPKVRFKRDDGSSYPAWEEAALNDISERIIVGLATTVTPYYRESGVPMFRNLNIRAGYLDDSNILYLDKEYASKQGGKYIHAGDILTVHTGNIGWSCVVPDCYEGALSFTTLITTLRSVNVINDYVCSYLNSDLGMKQMQDLAFSGGRANLNTSEFQKTIIPIPCLEEQQKIADFLSSVDEVITASEEEVANLETQKKAVMKKIFSQEVRFKRDDGTGFPDWEEILLNDISEMITVGIANSATHAYRVNGIVMFRNQNIKENMLDDSDLIYIDEAFEKKYKNKRLKENDILVARTGNPGIACLVPKKYVNAQTFTTLIVRLIQHDLYPEYICQYINSSRGKEYVASTQIGGGQKNSGAGIISKMPVMLPCLEEQCLIADFLSAFDEAISLAKKELELWKELKKGLLQQMFV